MYVYNNDDNHFNIGDTVFITNTLLCNEECYDTTVIQTVSDETTQGLGIHYVLYVRTHIDDYVTVRDAVRCFRSKEQYDALAKAVLVEHKIPRAITQNEKKS